MQFKRVGGLSVLAAAVAASLVTAQVQDPAARAAAILAESRKAIGGDDKLAAIKTLEIKATARRGATDVNLEGDMTIVMELPGKYLRKESIILGSAGIDIVEGLNGNESWEEQKFSGNMNFGDDGGGGNRGGGFRGGGLPGQTQNAAAGAAADPNAADADKQAQLLARQTEVARVDLARLLILLKLDISALMGYTGALYREFFGSSMGIVISFFMMLLWMIVPLVIARRIFRKKNL